MYNQIWESRKATLLVTFCRNILIMQTGKIVVEEYVKHAAGSNFQFVYKPQLLQGQSFQFQGRISVEFNLVYR